jgi:hypothetical protein
MNPASNTGYTPNYSDWDEGEDNDGPSQSLQYVDGLIEEEDYSGGFGQGCDLALFVEPADGAVAVLSWGVTCRGVTERGRGERPREAGVEMGTRMRTVFFLGYGTRDIMTPTSYYRAVKANFERLLGEDDEGGGYGKLECHEDKGMGHATCEQELLDLCEFLETVVPA